MSLKAYQKTLQTTDNPRNTEYRLFAQITRELMEAAKSGKRDRQLVEALDRNRTLWQVLANDCRHPDNKLPDELRASFISLSIWVTKHSSAVMRGEENVDDLIEINRTIMQGLAPQNTPGSATGSQAAL